MADTWFVTLPDPDLAYLPESSDLFRDYVAAVGWAQDYAAANRAVMLNLARQTEGVECRKDEGILDEIPGAYKDLDLVMAAQRDLVDVVHTLRAVMTVKG